MKKNHILFLMLFLGIHFIAFSQPFTLEAEIKNQPGNPVIFGELKGDKFTPIDSAKTVNNTVKFSFPENAHPGVYRLIFGQTLYARMMNEPPQQLDVIFNNENILLETDFNAPEDKLLVILSEENRVWLEFKRREILFREELNTVEKEVDFYRLTNNAEKLPQTIESYNRLQNRRNEFITEITAKNPGLLASEMILLFREPFLDGNLSAQERKHIFHEEYLKNKNFSNENLIYSQVYTDLVFSYLVSFNQKEFTSEQRETEYKKAVDLILAATNKNQTVYEFILGYLVHGFEVLQMNQLIEYIADNYAGTTCQTDEKTTLERKLLSQKMKPGTVVSDFTMNDINGDPVTLSGVLKEKTLLLFWASWCPHCNEMISFLKNRGIENATMEVITISLDTGETEWKEAVRKHNIESWFNLCDFQEWDGEVATEYNIYATPTIFIIDKNRRILATPVTINDLVQLSL